MLRGLPAEQVLTMLHLTVKRMPGPTLYEQLAVTTPALFDAFGHPDPEVARGLRSMSIVSARIPFRSQLRDMRSEAQWSRVYQV